MEDKNTKKAIKVHFDRLKKYERREKPFTLEPQAKQKTTVKEERNISLDSSEDNDIIEIESSADSESNLNSENQSAADVVKNSLNHKNDTVENGTKESEQETLKGQEKANKVAEGRGESSSKAQEKAGRKSAQTKIPKAKKKPLEGSSKKKY